jgi:hypothetical protein
MEHWRTFLIRLMETHRILARLNGTSWNLPYLVNAGYRILQLGYIEHYRTCWKVMEHYRIV